MVKKLKGIGKELKEFHAEAFLLSGLLQKCNTLVTAFDARPYNELTLECVKGKLLDEYRRKDDVEDTGFKSLQQK